MRAESASNAAKRAGDLITAAREAEIAGVLSPNGLTAAQIAERQYQIDRQSYALYVQREKIEAQIAAKQEELYQIDLLRKPIIAEITRLEDLNYNRTNIQIANLQKSLDIELADVDAKRQRWEDAQFQITLANTKVKDYQDSLTAANNVLDEVSKLWGGLTDKNLKVTIEQIESVLGGRNARDVLADQEREQQAAAAKAAAANSVTGFGQAPSAAETKAIVEAAKLGTPFGQAPSYVDSIGTPFGQAAPSAQAVKVAAQVAAWRPGGLSMGGLVPKYFAAGGFARGTDTVPAMLTPGEFVVKRFAVDKFGLNNLKSINNGSFDSKNTTQPVNNNSNSVYNYDISVNVANSNAGTDDIARAVISQIRSIDNQRIKGQR